MSLYLLATIIGILGGVLILMVIFSLLSQAQKGDAYLGQMGLGECGDRLETRQTEVGEAPDKESVRTAGLGQGS